MINKVILKGNLGRDPHIALDQRGREIATLSLATSTTWKDPKGEWQQHVDWHRIVVFRESTVRWIKDVLKKGDTVYVEGKLATFQKPDKFQQVRRSSVIIIAGNEGSIQYLRSKKNLPDSSQKDEEFNRDNQNTDDQNTSFEDFDKTPPAFLKSSCEGN
jgi:single-strand DNA-binding protein